MFSFSFFHSFIFIFYTYLFVCFLFIYYYSFLILGSLFFLFSFFFFFSLNSHFPYSNSLIWDLTFFFISNFLYLIFFITILLLFFFKITFLVFLKLKRGKRKTLIVQNYYYNFSSISLKFRHYYSPVSFQIAISPQFGWIIFVNENSYIHHSHISLPFLLIPYPFVFTPSHAFSNFNFNPGDEKLFHHT